MNKKVVILLIVGLILIYPLVTLFRLDQAISAGTSLEQVQERLLGFQVSIWMSWLFLAVMSIYYKWT